MGTFPWPTDPCGRDFDIKQKKSDQKCQIGTLAVAPLLDKGGVSQPRLRIPVPPANPSKSITIRQNPPKASQRPPKSAKVHLNPSESANDHQNPPKSAKNIFGWRFVLDFKPSPSQPQAKATPKPPLGHPSSTTRPLLVHPVGDPPKSAHKCVKIHQNPSKCGGNPRQAGPLVKVSGAAPRVECVGHP